MLKEIEQSASEETAWLQASMERGFFNNYLMDVL